MAIKYNVVPRRNPSNLELPAKYYAQAISDGQVDLRELADTIADISTVSSIDSFAAIEALLKTIPREMAKSKLVKLGDFGTFYITLNSEGTNSEASFTESNINKYTIRFRPGKLFKEALNNAGYVKA